MIYKTCLVHFIHLESGQWFSFYLKFIVNVQFNFYRAKRLFLLRAFNFNYYYNGSFKLFCNRHISAMEEFNVSYRLEPSYDNTNCNGLDIECTMFCI